MQTQTSNTLHNAIMEVGSKDRPPMLAPGNYVQWKSIIKRYIDTKPNHEFIHYCLKKPPYKLTWAYKEVPISKGSSDTTTEKYMETYKNVSQDIRDQLNAKAEAVQIILTGIDNDIYSTVDACPNACETWKAIERVKQDDEMSKDKEIDKLMALISLSFKKIYKPTNNNLRTSSNTSQANQYNSPRINRVTGYDNQRLGNVARARENVAYHRENMILCKQEEAGIQLNAEQADWKDDTDDESDDQELEALYMYMAKLQEVITDAVDNSGPIFDIEPVQQVQPNDNYNVFGIESEHHEQSESIHDTYLIKQDEHNVIIDSLDMSYDREQIDQNDDDNDLANERELLASLIEKLKCEINDIKNRNKFLETSNKVLVEKLKGEIEDFKNKNKSLESSNNRFNEANNKLSETNKLLYDDFKKSEAELARRNSVEYALKMEIKCAQKEAQIKLYKSREDKELDKVIALENKVMVLDNIVYKTGQSVQTMNMLNTPESDEVICLEKESRSKLSDLIRPFDYEKLNNLYDLFIPQREKSSEQRYFSERSRLSHTSINNGNSKESFNKQTTLLEKRMDKSITWDQKCKSSIELLKIKKYVDTIFDGVERCKEIIVNRTYSGYLDPFIQNTIGANFCPEIQRINVGLQQFHLCLQEEMVADLRYFNYLELEVDSLRSQLETQKTQFLNDIDRLLREYYYTDHMNAILGVYTELDEVTNLQCDYLEMLDNCECLEKELSKSKNMSKSFETLQKHAISLELELQQYLKAQLQDKGIAISELKKLIEKQKGNSVDTKFGKSFVVRQPNAFKSQIQSILGGSQLQPPITKTKSAQIKSRANKRSNYKSQQDTIKDGNPAPANVKQALGRFFARLSEGNWNLLCIRSTKVDESKVCDIPVVCEFPKVSSKDLIGLHEVKGGARVVSEDEFRAAEEREVLCEAQQGRREVKRKLFRSFRNKIAVDVWRRKGGVKPRRVRDIRRTIQAEISEKILVADGESKMIRLEMEQEMTKVVVIKEMLKEAKDRVVRFGKKDELAPRYVGPLEIPERIGLVACRLRIAR
nr:hypothetical protein [Tanacetum cinerariifolium]